METVHGAPVPRRTASGRVVLLPGGCSGLWVQIDGLEGKARSPARHKSQKLIPRMEIARRAVDPCRGIRVEEAVRLGRLRIKVAIQIDQPIAVTGHGKHVLTAMGQVVDRIVNAMHLVLMGGGLFQDGPDADHFASRDIPNINAAGHVTMSVEDRVRRVDEHAGDLPAIVRVGGAAELPGVVPFPRCDSQGVSRGQIENLNDVGPQPFVPAETTLDTDSDHCHRQAGLPFQDPAFDQVAGSLEANRASRSRVCGYQTVGCFPNNTTALFSGRPLSASRRLSRIRGRDWRPVSFASPRCSAMRSVRWISS